MKVLAMPIAQLQAGAAVYNPRKALAPGDREYEKLRRAIEEFGLVEPGVWNVRTRRVVGGHQRIRVCADLGHNSMPMVQVELEEAKEKALNLALNKIAGQWDLPKLKDLLEELDSGAFDVGLTGFDPDEIEGLMTAYREDGGGEEEPVPPLPAKARTRPGDLYELGRHRLLCGDATTPQDLERLTAGHVAAAMWTDPPYGVDVTGRTAAALKIAGDREEVTDLLLRQAWAAVNPHLAAGAAIYVCAPSGRQGLVFAQAFMRAGWLLHQALVWIKNVLVIGHSDYHHQHEQILYGWKRGGARQWWGGRDKSTVLDDDVDVAALKREELLALVKELRVQLGSEVLREDKPHAAREHPTMKPLELIRRTLVNSTARGDVVLEPFAGSGSTLIAAHQLARTCYALELDPRYCDVVVERWQNLSGQQAELAARPAARQRQRVSA